MKETIVDDCELPLLFPDRGGHVIWLWPEVATGLPTGVVEGVDMVTSDGSEVLVFIGHCGLSPVNPFCSTIEAK